MNLSCGNCKAIRSFSGEPPKCDACGWVCDSTDTPYWQKLRAERQQPIAPPRTLVERVLDDIKMVFVAIVKIAMFWVGVIGIGYLIYWVFQSEQSKLADKYNIPEKQVFVQPKPHGCDFNDAPLGNKHCHYEKSVDVIRACDRPDCKVTTVYVSWRKVEE